MSPAGSGYSTGPDPSSGMRQAVPELQAKCAYDAIEPTGDPLRRVLPVSDCVGIYHDPQRCVPILLFDKKGLVLTPWGRTWSRARPGGDRGLIPTPLRPDIPPCRTKGANLAESAQSSFDANRQEGRKKAPAQL